MTATTRPASSANNANHCRGSFARAPAISFYQAESCKREQRPHPVLELKGLCKSFGGLQATRDVTLNIMPGDRKAIIGPNGAGKTTLFNLITGIYPGDLRQCHCCSVKT